MTFWEGTYLDWLSWLSGEMVPSLLLLVYSYTTASIQNLISQPFICSLVDIYNCIYLASVFLSGLKLASALYNYHTRVSHPIQQNQAYQEIFEPLKGIIFFTVGLTVIKFTATLLFGIKFTCLQYLR